MFPDNHETSWPARLKEKLNMSDINTKSEAYNTGFEARVQGDPVRANPYPAGTVDASNWIAGWKDAA